MSEFAPESFDPIKYLDQYEDGFEDDSFDDELAPEETHDAS